MMKSLVPIAGGRDGVVRGVAGGVGDARVLQLGGVGDERVLPGGQAGREGQVDVAVVGQDVSRSVGD